MTRLCAFVGTAALVALLASPAHAVPILDQTLVATGGDVVVTFVSNEAGFTSELFLDGDFGDQLGAIFNNFSTPIGTMVNLGSFAAGTELVFKLLVQQTGDLFFTGDGSRNLDGLAHALLQDTGNVVQVGFEDLFGGGDRDFNDLVFAFTNVTPVDTTSGSAGTGDATTGPATVDEPGTLLMLGSGLAMLAFVMRRRPA